MSTSLQFDQIRLPPECERLRRDVRAFLAEEIANGTFDSHRPGHGDSHDRAFSKRIGARGWIGMTWPKKYGGHERSFLERYVVTEEFRVANAPVRLHFVADRQSGPILLKYAPEHIKADILPRICRGELCFVIGMRNGIADHVREATDHELEEQTRLRTTEDFKEGVNAVSERRTPNFKGR